jgi:hypothetical protein
MQSSNVFKPGKLPNNEYAYRNAIFLNPADYARFSSSKRICFVMIKAFVLELQPLQEIPEGEFAASSLQKDMLRISKIDSVMIQKASGLQENPLNSVEVLLDLVFADTTALTGSIVELSSDEIGDVMLSLFKAKFLNL